MLQHTKVSPYNCVLPTLSVKVRGLQTFGHIVDFETMIKPYINCHLLLVISRLHEVLMDLQNEQLKQLSNWLDVTEARIKQIEAQPLGPEIEDLKHQIEEHKVHFLYLR